MIGKGKSKETGVFREVGKVVIGVHVSDVSQDSLVNIVKCSKDLREK